MTYKEQDKLADFVKETVIEQGLGLTNYTDEEVTRLVILLKKNSTTTATTLGVAIANLTSSRAKATGDLLTTLQLTLICTLFPMLIIFNKSY